MITATFRYWLGVCAVIAFIVFSANAQVAGRLSGSVVDQTGASIPGATVNVYVRGGLEPVLSAKTNESGLFAFIAVRPDSYDVAVDAPGFTRVLLRDVKVAPIQETGLPAIKLDVQSATQSVEVSASLQAVQLTNSEVSSTITSTQVQNLPVLGRQVTTLFQSQAGVNTGSGPVTVNGLRSSFSTVSLDGVNIQDNFIRTNDLDYAPMRTTIDQIDDMTISTSNASAAIGGGASQMVLSTKSGSNEFHGAVYWYNRNSAIAANNWFNNKAGLPITFIDLNQPGASLRGRIIRDKLFFYTNYELYRNKQQSSRLRTVLTDSAKNGNFSYVDSATKNKKTVNLLTLKNVQLDPTMKAMIAQLPAPNTTDAGDGLNTSGYRFNARSNENRDQLVYKGDYYLSQKHTFTGTYNYISNPTDRPDTGEFFSTVPPVTNTIKDHLLALSWRWTASPTLTNELRGGFMRADTAFVDSNEYSKSILATAGLLFSSPANTFLNQGRKVNTYNLQNNANWLKGKHQVSFGYQGQFLRMSPFNDSGIIPAYTLGFSASNPNGLTSADMAGIGASDLSNANLLLANLGGVISSASQTFNVTNRTSGFVSGATNLRNFTLDTHAGYVQDKWKISPSLTLNLGVRYEYWAPLNEKDSLFLAPRVTGDIKTSVLDPNSTLDFIGGSAGRPFYKSDKNNFGPNVGFAWDPFGKSTTSVRGGYTMSFVNDNVVTAVRNNVGTSNGLQFVSTQSNLIALLANAPAVATPTYKVPRTLADNYAISTTSAIGIPDPNLVTPYVHQWMLSVEHDYKGAVFTARYLGNHASDLLRGVDYNQVLYNANGFLADFLRAQNNAALSQAANGSYNGTYNANIPGSQPLTVFPLLTNGGSLTTSTNQNYLRQGQVGEMANAYQVNKQNGSVNFYTNPNVQGANVITNGGYSTYHAVQFDVVKRTRSGLQAQFNYTFGKVLSNTTGDLNSGFEPLLDNNNPALEKARAPFDVTHVFKANYYYELPFGPGKHWSGRRLTNAFIGGWSLSGIWNYQSGSPYSILSGLGTLNRSARSTSTNTASVYGTNSETLNSLTNGVFMTGNGPYFVSPSIIGKTDGRGAATFGADPFPGQVFFNPAAGTVGNLQRRTFTGPWDLAWDASVQKTIKFAERHTLELHFDFFNWMNHPTFYVPPTSGDYGSQTNFTINNTTFGKITSMNHNPRVIQIGAYYRF